MLRIENLKYSYKDSNKIYTYNLSLEKGQILGIIGQSGSGKSTLLDLIAGFINSESGSIKLDGKELKKLSVEQRPLSILFQNHNLFEHLDVKTNIYLGLEKVQGKDTDTIKNILKEVGLEGFENKLASNLSGGQQQRVALARVLLRKESILLLDEPFTGLDEQTRLSMLELVQKITKEYNLHTIMVTHEIEDCEKIANKVYSIK